MAEHTPGPWRILGRWGLPEIHGAEVVVCERIYNHNEHLIAAAPDLLAACEAVREALRDLDCGHLVVCDQLEAAITRAKGGG